MTDRARLIDLMVNAKREDPELLPFSEFLADYLIANGVTVVTDANVGLKWISVAERLPDEYVSVLGHMTDTDGFPSVRECFLIGNEFWFPALLTTWPVDRWAELPEV